MKTLFFTLMTSLLSFSLWAQPDMSGDYPTGLIMEDEVYNQQKREPRFAGSKYSDLPFKVDLTPHCPEVGNQGRIQSCVGWSIGYGALTIQRAIQNGETDKAMITRNANSALFVYNQIKQNEDCNSGARIVDAVKFLQKNGNCLSSEFDQEINDCSKLPDPTLQAEAGNFAIADFMTLFAKDEKADIKQFKIQRALANGQPVVVGLKIYQNFATLHGMTTWNPKIGNQMTAGSHAMVVVGYNEARGAFQLMNSWGKEWGKDGFIWVKYGDFTEFCKYAYVLHLGENQAVSTRTESLPNRAASTTEQARIAGDFAFRYVDGFENDRPIMKDADVSFNGQYYRVNRTDWELGQFFQLVTTSSSANEYIYVFSVDGEGQPNIHWPRQAALNDKFEGMNESALVTTSGAEIYIPGIDRGLRLSKKGTEHLVILFAKREIEGIKEISDYMEGEKEGFYNTLTELLQEYIISTKDIAFVDDRISFTTNGEQGYIVPIVVELEAR